MKTPGFTAEAGLAESTTYYAGAAARSTAGGGAQVRAALVAPTVCKTSGCVTVGKCRTKVRCCRNFTGACTCSTVPCFFIGPVDSA
jgi:hypothetical protein